MQTLLLFHSISKHIKKIKPSFHESAKAYTYIYTWRMWCVSTATEGMLLVSYLNFLMWLLFVCHININGIDFKAPDADLDN